jgi:hypothetical protein
MQKSRVTAHTAQECNQNPASPYFPLIMLCRWVLFWVCGLLAWKLSIESPPELQALTLSPRLHSDSPIPYGALIQSLAVTFSCSTLPTARVTLVPLTTSCPLSTLFEAVSALSTQLILLSEEVKEDVPVDFAVPIGLISASEMAILTSYRNVSVRADFKVSTKERPVWGIAASSGAIIKEAVYSFNNVEIQVKSQLSEGPNLWINGEVYEGSTKSLLPALCASFSHPPSSCQSLYCTSHCTIHCDSLCFTAQCSAYMSGCNQEARYLRARSRVSSSSGGKRGSCSTVGCIVGLSVGLAVGCGLL